MEGRQDVFVLILLLCSCCGGNALNIAKWNNVLKEESKGKAGTCFAYPDPEVCMPACELVTSKGYPCEEHSVKTEDGFILTLHRIPCGHDEECVDGPRRPAVFLQHGLLSSSADWLNNLASESLGFILADAGYDVWLGNVRGNTYSRKHVKYSPSDDAFWAWSWDEMARFDLPAMISHALNISEQDQLSYIGHSQGTAIAFARLSMDQDLAKKIKVFFATGPVATLKHAQGAVRKLAFFTTEIKDLYNVLGCQDFFPNYSVFKILGSSMCANFLTRSLCTGVIFDICGPDHKYFNLTRLPVYLSHAPAGTSVRNMVHFSQMVRSGNFEMYDYGSRDANLKHYGQAAAPLYNVSNVRVPVYLYSANDDWLADPQDVALLAKKLPTLQKHQVVQDWNHLDFTWATNARSEIYENIISIMKKHP